MLAARVRYHWTNPSAPEEIAHPPHRSYCAPTRPRLKPDSLNLRSAMELNRNQFFMAGIFLMLLGIQFRLVDTITLNEKSTQFLAARTGSAATSGIANILPTS